MELKSEITDKDWLDIGWKYFQQHAQQRVSYLYFFIVFSTILTTAYVTSLSTNFPFIGIILGFVEGVLAFLFLKIDRRNKFLTKHGENIIKEFEKIYLSGEKQKFSIFEQEELLTNQKSEEQKNLPLRKKEFSHGKSYLYIYRMFMILSFAAMLFSLSFTFNTNEKKTDNEQTIENYFQIVALDNTLTKNDSIISVKLDSLIKALSDNRDKFVPKMILTLFHKGVFRPLLERIENKTFLLQSHSNTFKNHFQ